MERFLSKSNPNTPFLSKKTKNIVQIKQKVCNFAATYARMRKNMHTNKKKNGYHGIHKFGI